MMKVRAGSRPPTSSTTTWIDGSASTRAASPVIGSVGEVEALAGAREVGVGDGGQGEAGAGALLQQRGAGLEDLHHPGPDGAEAEHADADVVHAAHVVAAGPDVSGSGA